MIRRKNLSVAILSAVVFAGSLLVPSASFAQRYPDHQIQLIIPNMAGAIIDISARMLADELGQILGQKIIPINKPGVGSVLGTEAALRAKKDGYTLLYASNSAFVYVPASNPTIVHYDPIKDAEPLGVHYFFPQTITVRGDAPWKTFPELIDYAKKNPNKLRAGTIGAGSIPHFDLEMIENITGTQFTHVPFEGGEAVTSALLGGHVELICDAFSKQKLAYEGRMRILLVTNKTPMVPKVPTIAELGYNATLPGGWFGMYAPAGIPEEARKVLVPAVEKAIKNTKPKVDQLGNICDYKTPAEMRQMTEDEYKVALQIATRMGLRKR